MTGRGDAYRNARSAYECGQRVVALRFAALGAVVVALVFVGHPAGAPSWWGIAFLLAALAWSGWRGGAWRRGARVGMIAASVAVIAPSALLGSVREAACHADRSALYVSACFAVSASLGLHMGRRARRDASPIRFASIALAIPALAGLLGCGIAGIGTAIGVVIGLVAGGLTGWTLARANPS